MSSLSYAMDKNSVSRPKRQNPVTPKSTQFVWGAGIECSFVPHLGVDQFEWTQHNRYWKQDIKLAKDELGLTAIRYALPWHLLEPERGKFSWKMADERIEAFAKAGIDLYLDVMHFGTPRWLAQAAGDPEFPESLERFTHEMVERYSQTVHTWSPCNEPLVLSLFSGDFGFWPPHSRGWRGYMPVLSRVVQAVSRSIRAIRSAHPTATVLLCDHVEQYHSHDSELDAEVLRRNLRRFLVMDLLTGRVGHKHPLFNWITAYGFSELDLEWFIANPQSPSILGVDYYANSEWRMEKVAGEIRQRRSETPIGIHGIGSAYYQRYGLPMMITETSIDGKPINREIWMDQTIDDCRRLREEGIPMLGYFWWPLTDQIDWDGALTHRVGKVHEVGLFNLQRQADGTLTRHATPLVRQFAGIIAGKDAKVGKLAPLAVPAETEDENIPLGHEEPIVPVLPKGRSLHFEGSKGKSNADAGDRYGIVVFSHLRWGFVWQRPQQFLSRFARRHKVLFIEEPFFDLAEGIDPRMEYFQVMPNVTVAAPHMGPEWDHNPQLGAKLRELTRAALRAVNAGGEFDRPLHWYYSPMLSEWSLGHFQYRGIVYDCMDELSQFNGAPKSLLDHEKRLMAHADIVFTGGYELGERKKLLHPNVHPFGCGVEIEHFARALEPSTTVPPDIGFLNKPVLGWFGVIDERVDYTMIGEVARQRPNWSLAMIGPVVKVDPNLLPQFPNLYWLGGRDYQALPNYCKAFDVCMMPFAINPATQFINPTKGLEYMATGRPIVGTPVRDVVRQWSNIVWIANGAKEFIAAVEAALAEGRDGPRVRAGLELARESSWDSTVQKMQDLIREALERRSRPAAAKSVLKAESKAETAIAN